MPARNTAAVVQSDTVAIAKFTGWACDPHPPTTAAAANPAPKAMSTTPRMIMSAYLPVQFVTGSLPGGGAPHRGGPVPQVDSCRRRDRCANKPVHGSPR
jgi:hypothetical protein